MVVKKKGDKKMNKTDVVLEFLKIKDGYTFQHSLRVSKISKEIALRLGLNDKKIKIITKAGLLHDIGKIYLPNDILNKTGKLKKYEMKLIKKHSELGAELLKKLKYNDEIIKIVLYHHEKLNGTGYPGGLLNNEICLESKIVGISDVIDAMLSNRIYSENKKIDEVISELNKNKGVLYDEEIADICIENLKKDEVIETIKLSI